MNSKEIGSQFDRWQTHTPQSNLITSRLACVKHSAKRFPGQTSSSKCLKVGLWGLGYHCGGGAVLLGCGVGAKPHSQGPDSTTNVNMVIFRFHVCEDLEVRCSSMVCRVH